MTTVTSGEFTRRRHQWTVPAPWPRGAVIGDVQDAIGMAATAFEQIHAYTPRSDDWLRMDVGDEEVIFWFEVDETPGTVLPPEVRRSLQVVLASVQAVADRGENVDIPWLIGDLQKIVRGGEVTE